MIQEIGGTFVITTAIAIVWTVALFAVIERSPRWSIPFGLGTGIPIIGIMYWYGENEMIVSVSEMKWLILSAVIGAIIGIGSVVAVLKPESE